MATQELPADKAPTGTDVSAVPPRASRLRRFLADPITEAGATFVIFLILFAVYGIWLGSEFLNVDARVLDIHQSVPLLLLGLAGMVTLAAGVFDLSIASMAALTMFLSVGLPTNEGLPLVVALLICLALGAFGGLINGFLVERLRINAFIATLGTGGVFLGASNVYGKGGYITPEANPLDTWFINFGQYGQKAPEWLLVIAAIGFAVLAVGALGHFKPARFDARTWIGVRVAIVAVIAVLLILVLDLPEWIESTSWLVLLILAVGMLLWTMMQFTTSGRYLKAAGANRSAARLAGVKVQKEVTKSFVIAGLLSALAGIVLGALQGSAAPNVATPLLLPAFAAAFLSTVVLSRGHFTVWGTIIGGIFLVWVSQGLIVGGLPAQWSDIVNGAALLLVVAVTATVFRRTRSN